MTNSETPQGVPEQLLASAAAAWTNADVARHAHLKAQVLVATWLIRHDYPLVTELKVDTSGFEPMDPDTRPVELIATRVDGDTHWTEVQDGDFWRPRLDHIQACLSEAVSLGMEPSFLEAAGWRQETPDSDGYLTDGDIREITLPTAACLDAALNESRNLDEDQMPSRSREALGSVAFPSDEIRCALSTLGELYDEGAVDAATEHLSSRQVDVAKRCSRIGDAQLRSFPIPATATEVWLLLHDDKHGADVTLHDSYETGLGALMQTIGARWNNITHHEGVPSSPDGMTDQDAVDLYFKHRSGTESYELYSAPVERGTRATQNPVSELRRYLASAKFHPADAEDEMTAPMMEAAGVATTIMLEGDEAGTVRVVVAISVEEAEPWLKRSDAAATVPLTVQINGDPVFEG